MTSAFNQKSDPEAQHDPSSYQQIGLSAVAGVDRPSIPTQQVRLNANLEGQAANSPTSTAKDGTPVVAQHSQLLLPQPSKEIRIHEEQGGQRPYQYTTTIIACAVPTLVAASTIVSNPAAVAVAVPVVVAAIATAVVFDYECGWEMFEWTGACGIVKNKKLQGCMTRGEKPEFIQQGFQFPLTYSTCQHVAANAQLQTGRIEFNGFCVSSKDVKFRQCTSDREFTWTQKLI
ncbi:hypothetical protein HDU97_008320 [Phlyctochytrium planicorne]|nr:hypothetical protein HDU97_008320 [Phlyctochytrium planicorne]